METYDFMHVKSDRHFLTERLHGVNTMFRTNHLKHILNQSRFQDESFPINRLKHFFRSFTQKYCFFK